MCCVPDYIINVKKQLVRPQHLATFLFPCWLQSGIVNILRNQYGAGEVTNGLRLIILYEIILSSRMRSRVSEFCISLMMYYVSAPWLFSAMFITHATTDEGVLKYYVFICDARNYGSLWPRLWVPVNLRILWHMATAKYGGIRSQNYVCTLRATHKSENRNIDSAA